MKECTKMLGFPPVSTYSMCFNNENSYHNTEEG